MHLIGELQQISLGDAAVKVKCCHSKTMELCLTEAYFIPVQVFTFKFKLIKIKYN